MISACKHGEQGQQVVPLLNEKRDVQQVLHIFHGQDERDTFGCVFGGNLDLPLFKMREVTVDPDVITGQGALATNTYSAGIGACENGRQLQRGLALLGGVRDDARGRPREVVPPFWLPVERQRGEPLEDGGRPVGHRGRYG